MKDTSMKENIEKSQWQGEPKATQIAEAPLAAVTS